MSETVRSVLPSVRCSITSPLAYKHSITAAFGNCQKVLLGRTWHCHERSSADRIRCRQLALGRNGDQTCGCLLTWRERVLISLVTKDFLRRFPVGAEYSVEG